MFPNGSAPFGGQAPFNKPTANFSSTAFSGAGGSLFSATTSQQSTTGGLFGTNTPTSSFGQTQTPQSFGSGGGLFGSQNATTSNIFGSTSSSTFVQPKPFGFGSQQQSQGLFGQPSQPTQPSLFGQPSVQSTSGLFTASSGFGGTASGGTTIKFTPVTGTDTMLKNGSSTNINTRHHCITCMKEYENKSLEELRLEDYAANRKGVQQVAGGGSGQGSLSLFGTPAQPTSLFGGSPSTSGFGSSSSGGGVFGGAGGSGSLFSKPAGAPTAFGAPPSTAAPSFGFNPTTPTTNPFGGTNNTQKPFGASTAPSGLFGQTTQTSTGFGTQPSSGFGSFGTQQNAGGLFGASKPTFNLGNTNTSSAFTFNQPSTTNSGSNIFGAKPATSTFGGFGTSATTSSFGNTTFGSSNQNSSIFGNSFGKPSTGFNFGSTSTTNTLGQSGLSLGGGSLFGSGGQKTGGGGLFGQTNTGLFGGGGAFPAQGSFNSGANTLTSSALLSSGNQQSLGAGQNLNPLSQHMLAYASMPFGDSPLFKNLLPQTGKTDELLKPTSPAAQKALITGQNFKASPKSNSKIKVVPIEATTKKSMFDGLDDDLGGSSELFGESPRASPKRLVLRPRPLTELSLSATNLQPPATAPKAPPPPTSQPSLSARSLEPPPLESTMAELCQTKENNNYSMASIPDDKNSKKDPVQQETSNTSSSGDSSGEEGVSGREGLGVSGREGLGVTLTRSDYYTIPPVEELARLAETSGSCLVDNFTIGRLNYGNIFFPEPINVAGLNLDEIVHFRHKEVIVYPDESVKPAVGEGLNRKAQVTLDRVWPVDKSTRSPITDPARIHDLDYEAVLRRASAKKHTKFIEYRPQTGSWVFKVDHFSKYGLSDSDEEEAIVHEVKKQKLVSVVGDTASRPPPFPTSFPPFNKQAGGLLCPPMQITDEDEDMDDGIRNPFDLDERLEGSGFSPTSRLAQTTGASPHKIQLMKASFFDPHHPSLNIDGEYIDYEDILEHPSYEINGFTFNSKHLVEALTWYKSGTFNQVEPDSHTLIKQGEEVGLPLRLPGVPENEELMEEEPICLVQPKVYVLKHWRETLPLVQTTVGLVSGSGGLLDVGLLKGRGWPLKWATGSQLLWLSPASAVSPAQLFAGRLPHDTSPPVIHRVAVAAHTQVDITFTEVVEGHLAIALKQSFSEEEDGCLRYFGKAGVSGLLEHAALGEELWRRHPTQPAFAMPRHTWALLQALWGPLPIEDSPESHLTLQQRKSAVSEWLRCAVGQRVSEELHQHHRHDDPANVFTHLTGYQISQACKVAQDIGDHQLSLLLSAVGSGAEVRTRALRQLAQWKDTQADQFIHTTRLKLYMLAAGVPTHQASDRFINTCANLDWMRAFALHLWYTTGVSCSLVDALAEYECGFEGESGYAPPPWAASGSLAGEQPVFHLHYHLLKLFSSKAHPLEQLLNPAATDSHPLDYSLSWFLMRILNSLGYSHTSEHAACLVHTSFASQLEAHGLWHWSVFILLHIPDATRRKNAVLDMIGRHISIASHSDQEDFVLRKLRIPSAWVFEAKAQKALFLHRYDDAAQFLMNAKLWNKAHTVIVDNISSKAIINEKYEYLEGLLVRFVREGVVSEVDGWLEGGGVLLEYLEVAREVAALVARSDPSISHHLTRLRPRLATLAHNINLLQSTLPLDRLREDEMTKRISSLLQSLLVGGCVEDSVEEVSRLGALVSQLPLTGDSSQWEWLQIMAAWHPPTAD